MSERERQQAVKGMSDILPPEIERWHQVETRSRATFETFGFRELRTPLLEYTTVFCRSIGETTDIVEKEMYSFEDRDRRSLSLRPEGTASAVRAYIEHAIFREQPVTRWYYLGPMFRHERQQRGRSRQFHQLGAELFGVAEPTADAELCAMVVLLFEQLGVRDVDVLVNCLGGPADRPAFRAALHGHFAARRGSLCEDCQRRLDANPLRILDCKQPGCQAAAADAPHVLDHLGEASRAHFQAVCATLELLGVAHIVEPTIVRGLDYYTGTVFEVRGRGGQLGAQNTLCGGGRYDGLVESFGGPATPAVGLAIGLDRLSLCLPDEATRLGPALDLFLVAHGDAARRHLLRLALDLRRLGLRVELEHRPASVKAQLRRADHLAARHVALVGEGELSRGVVTLRDMKSSQQAEVPEVELAARLAGG